MIWTAVRVLLILGALAVLFSTVLYVQSSDGPAQLQTDGLVIDVIALGVLVALVWSFWRDRRRA